MALVKAIWSALQNICHARVIKRSGLFQRSAYRSRYLARSKYIVNPFLHYLVIGEWRGNRPNALFDPLFFVKTSGTKHIWRYLSDRTLWRQKTCSYFDGDYYCSASSRDVPADVPPLVDFWHHGFDSNANGSDVFDVAFFKRATTRDMPDKKALAFSTLTRPEHFPLSAVELRRRQDRFYDDVEMVILKDNQGQAKRQSLVFVQAAADYHSDMLEGARNFDVLLNYYEPVSDYDDRCDIAIYQKGTKVTGIRKILEQRPEFLLKYDYVLFLDDDVAITNAGIERFFDVMRSEGLDLAQPSLTEASMTFFEDLKQPRVGPSVRELTTVEIMMPGLSRRALERCGWVFSTAISGWAVDFLLGAEIKKAFSTHPAVVGECIAEHLRPLDTENGTFYRFLRRHGIDPNVEAGAIALRYDIDDSSNAIRLVDG